MDHPDILIIGAGLAGLCCARRLAEQGQSFQILEAADQVGGRIRTDLVHGFRLDRGFQIFLTSYPEARRILDYEDLQLQKFTRGALIRYRGRFHRLVDPRKQPFAALGSITAPIGTFRDKIRLCKAALRWSRGEPEANGFHEESLTLDFLRWNGGFTEQMIDQFFRPFFGGVFLEKKLLTSSRFFRFLFKMFSQGDATLPAQGMQAIPEQIANQLPKNAIRFHTKVEKIEGGKVILSSGEVLSAKQIILATEGPTAARLLENRIPEPSSRGVTCLYFATERPPINEPILMLDGENRGPVNNLVVLSAAAPSYAPPGQSLLYASVLGVPEEEDQKLEARVRVQMNEWFGPQVKNWRLLRVDRIPHALPDQSPLALDPPQRAVRLEPGLYVCGDHRENASINGAMTSGYRAAQAVLEDLQSGIKAGPEVPAAR